MDESAPRRGGRQDYGALEQRVYNVEQGLRDISQAIGALSQKIDASSRTPWAVIIAAMGVTLSVMTMIGNLAKAPVDMALTRLDADVRQLEQSTISRDFIQELQRRIGHLEDEARARKPGP